VSGLAFPARPAPEAWWRQPDNIIDYGRWIFYAVAGLLGFLLIVRPLLKIAQQRLALPPATGAALPGVAADGAAASGAAGAALGHDRRRGAASVAPLLGDYDLPPSGSPVDVMVDHLKVLAVKEPERVAEVVKQWVQQNVRSE